jgi:hypothetical protein
VRWNLTQPTQAHPEIVDQVSRIIEGLVRLDACREIRVYDHLSPDVQPVSEGITTPWRTEMGMKKGRYPEDGWGTEVDGSLVREACEGI